jgi:hypothetical protein
MLKPDLYFDSYLRFDFNKVDLLKAKIRFRRAIREYYVNQRKYVINPESGEKVLSVRYGSKIVQQKNQKRRVDLIYSGRKKAGRAVNFAIKILISRLIVLWGLYAKKKSLITWKNSSVSSDFEYALSELLPKLGATNVRRYLENHWKERKQSIYIVK